jgi:beta-galactosidase
MLMQEQAEVIIKYFFTMKSFWLYITVFAFFSCNNKHTSLEKFNFNKGWYFVKVNDSTVNTNEVKNQGNDWQSQYDVTHTSSNASLAVAEDILKKELAQIKNANWESVILPHNPVTEPLTIKHQWQGICYYRKIFKVAKDRQEQKCYIEFEGAMQLADVWVNGKHVMQHAGGYTPFVIDISEDIKYGVDNEILVRLDNRNNPIIPPGKPVEKLDFSYHGGIYRDVNLIFKNRIHITDPVFANEVAGGGVFVKYPLADKDLAVVDIKTHVNNETEKQARLHIKQKLFSVDGLFENRKTGKLVEETDTVVTLGSNSARHYTQRINVVKPNLWYPDAPSLYLLVTEIRQDDKVLDAVKQRIGIRRIKFTVTDGFEINGKKLRLVGANRHQEYPYIGNAVSDNAQYRDILNIKKSGFNIVRLGHYIQDKSVLNACDELGLLVIEPIPGWQFFNDNKLFCDLTYRDIRMMIRRDRNHPSMVMWEVILNESWPPKWWKDKASAIAHEEYPGDQMYTSGDTYGYYGWDVQYNDWKEGFYRPNDSGKPGFIREYYDYEFGGHYSTTRIARGDGEIALRQNAWNAQWSHNRYRAYYPWTSGDAIWSMYDYNRGCCDNICRSGIADIFRLEKFSVPFFKSQMDIGTPLPQGAFKPYIFIASFWNKPVPQDKVIVYSNVEEVALLINGREEARQKPDDGPDTDYSKTKEMWYKGGNPFDGGNCRQLEHPPFTFNNIKWKRGKIEAVGYVNGKEVCRHVVQTPEEPSALKLSYFEPEKPASKNDLLIVYVRLLDDNGTLCVEREDEVSLVVEKGGNVVGPDKISAEAGIASFLVRTNENDKLVLRSRSNAIFANEMIILK